MRHQLPVYSPLSLGAILRAAGTSLTGGAGAGESLQSLLAARFEADRVTLTASATQALQLALSDRRPANRDLVVALPAYSCFDLVTAAVGVNAKVRFYNIDPLSLAPDMASVRQVLAEGVSVLVAGNLYGYPLDWSALAAESAAEGVELIEDAAQGVGTATADGRGGTLGPCSVLSFGRGKGWTGGGGGALLERWEAAAGLQRTESRRLGRSNGSGTLATVAAWGLGRPSMYGIPSSIPALGLGLTKYRPPTPPSMISSFSAALACRTADASTAAVTDRRQTASKILDALSDARSSRGVAVRPCVPLGGTESASYLRMPFVARTSQLADALAARGRALGIARGYPTPLHHLSQATPLRVDGNADFPGARELATRLVTFPTHEFVTQRDIAAIAGLLGELR